MTALQEETVSSCINNTVAVQFGQHFQWKSR